MTAATQPGTQAEPDPPRPPLDGADATAFGNLVRFRPQDGIFLRAEHLTVMQTYAAELARAVGLATGSGVVYGFRPTIAEDKLSVETGSGLAIDPIGRPLHATNAAKVAFVDADRRDDPNGYWVLEIRQTTTPFGTEPVFGSPCEDPCSGSTLTPWLAEGVLARLRRKDLKDFASVTTEKRSRLASDYFEEERTLGEPWLVPAGPGGAVAPITGRPWTDVAGEPSEVWVPLGVVWFDGDEPQLDVWTARREIHGRLATDLWRTRLAMRPWNAFLAQVLQFQDQLSTLPAGWAATPETGRVDTLHERVETFVKAMADTPVTDSDDFRQLIGAFEQAAGARAALGAGTSLRELGFRELPPAGLLPRPKGDDVEEVIRGWFPQLDVQFVDCRADHVPGALERARDLDRIPLSPKSTQPHIDVLIPLLRADIDPLEIDGDTYGWVAFVRRDEILARVDPPPEPELDVVEVYHHQGALDDTMSAFLRGEPRGERVTPDLRYPKDTWEYPGGDTASAVDLVDGDVEVIAVTSEEGRRPLAALRASLFLASLRQQNFSRGRFVHQVHAVVPQAAGPEIIVIVQPGGDIEPVG